MGWWGLFGGGVSTLCIGLLRASGVVYDSRDFPAENTNYSEKVNLGNSSKKFVRSIIVEIARGFGFSVFLLLGRCCLDHYILWCQVKLLDRVVGGWCQVFLLDPLILELCSRSSCFSPFLPFIARFSL